MKGECLSLFNVALLVVCVRLTNVKNKLMVDNPHQEMKITSVNIESSIIRLLDEIITTVDLSEADFFF